MTAITGTIRVECPGCGAAQECRLVQSINTRTSSDEKRKLLAGELNVLACACGRDVQLAAIVVFHDPDAELLIQVCPGDEAAMAKAADLMRSVGGSGSRRLVPSLNALVEKVKLCDAGLDDRAIEMAKVLLLASRPQPDLELVLLFDALDRQAGVIHWLLFGPGSDAAERVASTVAAYERLVAHARRSDALRIDRAWAIEAVRAMIASGN